MTHIELRALIPAYALDALSSEEAREVEAHLATCDECRRELILMREVASELATAVPRTSPPATLRTKILEAVRTDESVQSVPSVPPLRIPARDAARFPAIPRLPHTWIVGVAALAAALAVVFAGLTLSLNQRLSALNDRLAAQERVLALLANPESKTAALAGTVSANVRFVYNPGTRQGALVVTELGDPGAEQVYQLWLIAGQEPESAGVFRPVAGRPIIVPVRADFSRYQAVAISIERGPLGAARPSSAPILLGSL
ncbi:MAG TPA: anti-sigma factor [bacterium]|nr:anti-sigma factor [bacterium]